MAILGLVVVFLAIWVVLSQLPKGYRCHRCNCWFPSEIEALGHQKEAELHKITKCD